MKTPLEHVRANRADEFAPAKAILDLATSEDRDLTPEEAVEVRTVADLVKELDERIAELDDLEERNARATATRIPAFAIDVRSEPLTYSRNSAMNEKVSYLRDLTLVAKKDGGDNEAKARLDRHAREMDVELVARARKRENAADSQAAAEFGRNAPSPFEKRVNPNRTDGQGGYLVPPLWLMDELIPILRAGRTVANQVRHMDLPDGTDNINIPKLSTGTATAIQTADAASVTSTDFADTSISAGVKTVAGQQDVALQLIEQSPLNVDQIVFTDLLADLNKRIDLQVLAGSNASGQVKGLYSSAGASPWSSYNQITYTDASPTAGEMFTPFAQMLSQIAQTRFATGNVKLFLHPRRWFWLASYLDTTNRPLIVPSSMSPYNAMGVASEVEAEGFVGNLVLGTPVFIDPNITVADTAGSGTGQDIAIALKTDDALLFEGAIRQRSLPEILSGTMQVRFQVYEYLAFLLRYDQALAIASGTGFAAPSGF